MARKEKSLPGNEFADGPVGQFMAWLGEWPGLTPAIIPGVIVGVIGFVAGAGGWSLALGAGASAAYLLIAPRFIS